MNIERFAEITKKIISENGIEEFIPTICLPEQGQIVALEDISEDADFENEVFEYALSKANSDEEEVLFVFRSGPKEFTILQRKNGNYNRFSYDT